MRSTDVLLGTSGVFYSYATCGGDMSKWINDAVDKSVQGKHLKMAVPSNNLPDHYMVDENEKQVFSDSGQIWSQSNEDGDGRNGQVFWMRGLLIDYMNELAKIGGFTVDYVPVSKAAKVSERSGEMSEAPPTNTSFGARFAPD